MNEQLALFLNRVKIRFPDAKVFLFGSRARGDFLLESDVDVLIISDGFKDIFWPRRLGLISEMWDGFVVLEPLCYTPEEFEKKRKQLGVVSQAIKEGKRIL